MHELELKKHKTIEERLDAIERQKYYCNICERNHYYDTKIGKEHFSQRKKDKSKTKENIWNEIKILHNKANDLMKKQSILNVDLRIKYKELGKKNSSTKAFKNMKDHILNMEDKHRKLSAEITNTLRKKDLLLKKVKEIRQGKKGYTEQVKHHTRQITIKSKSGIKIGITTPQKALEMVKAGTYKFEGNNIIKMITSKKTNRELEAERKHKEFKKRLDKELKKYNV